MTFTYLDKFGYDAKRRRERLAFLSLGEGDHELARAFARHVAKPQVEQLVDQFYLLLGQQHDFLAVMARGFDRDRLKRTMRDYLLHFGRDFDSQRYFDARLRIGLAHIWAGVDLSVYQCAYRLLQQLLIDAIPRDYAKREVLISFILKITTLDMSLAIEAYHCAQVEGLEEAYARARSRGALLAERLQRDGLTRVLTRESILGQLELLVSDQRQRERPAVVVMIDLDHFKQVNDQYGHLVGDDVLREVSQRLRGRLRAQDLIGRYGGEEFLLVLPQTGLARGREVCERLREVVAGMPVLSGNHKVTVTISIGVTEVTMTEEVETVIQRADQAMYQAKQAGRNRVEVTDVARG